MFGERSVLVDRDVDVAVGAVEVDVDGVPVEREQEDGAGGGDDDELDEDVVRPRQAVASRDLVDGRAECADDECDEERQSGLAVRFECPVDEPCDREQADGGSGEEREHGRCRVEDAVEAATGREREQAVDEPGERLGEVRVLAEDDEDECARDAGEDGRADGDHAGEERQNEALSADERVGSGDGERDDESGGCGGGVPSRVERDLAREDDGAREDEAEEEPEQCDRFVRFDVVDGAGDEDDGAGDADAERAEEERVGVVDDVEERGGVEREYGAKRSDARVGRERRDGVDEAFVDAGQECDGATGDAGDGVGGPHAEPDEEDSRRQPVCVVGHSSVLLRRRRNLLWSPLAVRDMDDRSSDGRDGTCGVEGAESEVLALTRDLVSIPSHEDETAAGDHIEGWLREHAPGSVLRDEHGNVFALRTPTDAPGEPDEADLADAGDVTAGDRPTLALVGHHDVVPPDDSQVDDDGAYRVRVEDDRIYGRGTADMKGAVAAAMLAFRDADLDAGEDDPGNDLAFASFVGEEVGGEGCRAAIADGFAPTWAVVGEGSTGYSAPGVTDVAVAHKGRRAVTVTAEGEAAHASVPDEGENAIYRATDAVDVLRDLAWPTVEVAGETLSGSVVVTEIEGGSAWNVLPERCSVTVDERTVPGERAAVDQVTAVDGVTWTVDQDLPPMRCRDDAFADAVLAAATDAQDGAPELVTKPHATDAGWLDDRAGTACVVCGVAEPGEAHTATESASVHVLQRCYDVYRSVASEPVGHR